MAMLATWAFCNRGRNPSTTAFPSGILICAPNLTVKNRLQVLRPEEAENYYDTFDIVPAKYRELMAGYMDGLSTPSPLTAISSRYFSEQYRRCRSSSPPPPGAALGLASP